MVSNKQKNRCWLTDCIFRDTILELKLIIESNPAQMEIVSWLSHQASKIAENLGSSHSFYVKCSPEDQVDSSTILALSPYASRQELALIPCSYRWFRIKNKILEQRQEFKGNSYICGLSDIGSILQVQITGKDISSPGTEVLSFGPVSINCVLRQAIKASLSRGYGKFYAVLSYIDQQLQCSLTVCKKQITITHVSSGFTFSFSYAIGDPLVSYHQQDDLGLRFVFNEEVHASCAEFLSKMLTYQCQRKVSISSNQIDLKFRHKRAREEFSLVMKAFSAERELKNSAIINKIERISIDENLDLLLEIESLRNDLTKMYEAYNKEREERFAYFSENLRLEEQIAEILQSYSSMFSERLKVSENAHKRSSSIISIMSKYRDLEAQNEALRGLVNLDRATSSMKEQQFVEYLITQKEKLEEQNRILKQTIEELRDKPSQQKQEQLLDDSQTVLHKYFEKEEEPSEQESLNPQHHSSSLEIEKMKNLISNLQIQKIQWKSRCQKILSEYQQEKTEHRHIKQKLQSRIKELNEEISSTKRSNDAINRSYNLSIELQDYNYQQNKVLRDQNDFLLSETQKLSNLCDRYKSEYKKLKQMYSKSKN